MKSDHITEFTGSVGVYFNLPLSKHFSLGTKALIGRSVTQELDIDGHAEGNKKDISYTLTLDNTPGHKQTNGDPTMSVNDLKYPNNTGEKWTDEVPSHLPRMVRVSRLLIATSPISPGASTATTTTLARSSQRSMIPST